jgi:hypothetical protein
MFSALIVLNKLLLLDLSEHIQTKEIVFIVVLGFELRVDTFSHSTSPIL